MTSNITRFWIEVSSEYQFNKKANLLQGLNAPNNCRYRNMLSEVNTDDIILHYITLSNVIIKEHGSSILGLSKIKSKLIKHGKSLSLDLRSAIILPKPIHIYEIKGLKNKSEKLEHLLIVNFQRYISQITENDFINIIDIHPENAIYAKQESLY
jgi:hypothetical protein